MKSNTCKRTGCGRSARRDYCSTTCRKAAWLARHIPRCPTCNQALNVRLVLEGAVLAVEPRSERRPGGEE